MKKLAIFYTIFLAVQSSAVLASRRCSPAKSRWFEGYREP